jgi:hypothetical protein
MNHPFTGLFFTLLPPENAYDMFTLTGKAQNYTARSITTCFCTKLYRVQYNHSPFIII